MLGGLLEREVTRDDREWAAAMASLTVSERVQIKPSRRQHEENERDCRTVVQLNILGSWKRSDEDIIQRKRTGIGTQRKIVTFEEPDQEWREVDLKNPEQ